MGKRKYKQYLNTSSILNVSKRTRRRWKQKLGIVEGDWLSDEENDFATTQPTANTPDTDQQITSTCSQSSTSSTCSNKDSMEHIESEEPSSPIIMIPSETTPEEEEEFQNFIFEKTKITAHDIYAMIYGLSLRHQMTDELRNDFVEIIKLCAGVDNDELRGSKYFFDKFFNMGKKSIKYTFYCDTCFELITDPINEIVEETKICGNCQNQQLISLQNDKYFVTVDPTDQIVSLLQDSKMFTVENTESNQESITDIFDGNIYKDRKKLADFHLTYNFNTDGAPIFKSSKCTMWPIQIIINEMKPKYRFRNAIFAGLWIGKSEPKPKLMNSFITAFSKEAENLFLNGVQIRTGNNVYENIKLLPLMCCVDSVARPVLQNRKQFNGDYSCSWCYHPAETVGSVKKYPWNYETQPRTAESHRADVEEHLQSGAIVRGVKGPAEISNLPYFDPVWSFPCEYMHGVLLGVVKQLVEYWLKYIPGSQYYIGSPNNLKKINKRLMNLKPPHEIHRLPRPITEKAKWKASEWRAFLLFYGIPCLEGILNRKYLSHFALLVNAIYTLLKERISETDLIKTEKDLKHFVKKTEILYGKEAMTFNMHCLIHYVDSVRMSGPLWATSAFPFESGIHMIKKQVKGPTGLAKVISKKMVHIKLFLHHINNQGIFSDICLQFCQNLFGTSLLKYASTSDGITFLGASNLINKTELQMLFPNVAESDYLSYKRFIYNGILFQTSEYTRAQKNINTIAITTFGFVEIIKVFTNKNDHFIYAKKLNTKPYLIRKCVVNHLFHVEESQEFMLLPFHFIIAKCILLQCNNKSYISTLPNTFEIQ